MDITFLTVAEANALISAGQLSPVELTQMCLERIAELSEQNPALNAWITVAADSAMEEARAAENRMMLDARLSPLDGIPIGLKDNIDTAGLLTTAASHLFRDRIPAEDAAVVRLLRRAGAVILGKLNLHEFAYGGSNVVSAYGPTRNPWNPLYLTGGSSGGAAVAVAAGMCLAAIGSDTAGSIRLPAACCGVVGFKPTYGLVSTQGVIPLSWSLDHVGPITQTVEDAALLMDVLADSSQGSYESGLYEARQQDRAHGLRLGMVKAHFLESLEPAVGEAFQHALEVFRSMDAEIVEVEMPVNTDRTVQAAESYAYHETWASDAAPEGRTGDYQPETLRRIRSGAALTAGEYIRARQVMEIAAAATDACFADIDAMLTPTSPISAPTFAQVEANPDQLRPLEVAMLRNTRPFNVLGLPAISVPCGFSKAELPLGLQIAARHGNEDMVLAVADAYEQATAWHKRRPRL